MAYGLSAGNRPSSAGGAWSRHRSAAWAGQSLRMFDAAHFIRSFNMLIDFSRMFFQEKSNDFMLSSRWGWLRISAATSGVPLADLHEIHWSQSENMCCWRFNLRNSRKYPPPTEEADRSQFFRDSLLDDLINTFWVWSSHQCFVFAKPIDHFVRDFTGSLARDV